MFKRWCELGKFYPLIFNIWKEHCITITLSFTVFSSERLGGITEFKPGTSSFRIIVSNVRIVSVTEFLVTQSGLKDRTQFYRDDRFASDVRIV